MAVAHSATLGASPYGVPRGLERSAGHRRHTHGRALHATSVAVIHALYAIDPAGLVRARPAGGQRPSMRWM